MIRPMINAHDYMTAFDNAGVSPYGNAPLKVMLGDNGPFEVDRVEVDVSDNDNPLGAVLYVTDPAATDYLSKSNYQAEGSPDTQPAEVRDSAFTPGDQADQVPASGGSGQISSSTGPTPRREY